MKKKRLVLGALLLLLVTLASTELLARFYLGLGDPPLTIRDPAIDYLFAPARCYERFQNEVCYNRWSMRGTRDVPARKTSPDELRVLVLGDSVINGGALTDDGELATRIVEQALQHRLGRPVWVANISAGSWGPGNLLAQTRKYGWFEADVAIIVVSSHDLADVPEFLSDLGPDFPEQPPVLALEEAVFRYLPRYLPALAAAASEPPAPPDAATEQRGRELFRQLLGEAKKAVEHVFVLHHRERGELDGLTDERSRRLRRYAGMLREDAERLGVPFVELAPYLATKGAADSYRDGIHLNATGQQRLAAALQCIVSRSLEVETSACR